jgi:hypothetical protein
VHLVGFITKKFVTMHGHMNVKKVHRTNYVRKTYTVEPPVQKFENKISFTISGRQ